MTLQLRVLLDSGLLCNTASVIRVTIAHCVPHCEFYVSSFLRTSLLACRPRRHIVTEVWPVARGASRAWAQEFRAVKHRAGLCNIIEHIVQISHKIIKYLLSLVDFDL